MNYDMQHLTFQNLNCEIHYWYRKGSGNRWVFFFHGAGVDHEMFESQFNALDDSYHIIAWDARGHGLSKLGNGQKFHFSDLISDCKKLFALYSVQKAVFIGQSMGGNLAQEIAYYDPDMVEKLVLIDCTRNTGKLTSIEKYTLKCSRFLFHCYPWKTLIRQSADACGNRESVRQYVRSCFEKLDKETFIDIMMELTGCLHEDTNYMFRQSVLLLCGADDKLGNIRKIAEPWAKSDPNCCQLHLIQNAGHNANQDQPEEVNELICRFLKD